MELFDICDENGIPTGKTVERSRAHREGIRHRTAHIWVIRTVEGRGQVLLQKRSQNKDSFPGQYDTSSAGHIQAGDEPLASAQRELLEELGIEASEDQLIFIGNFRNQYEEEFHGSIFKDNEVSFVYVYDDPVEIEELNIQEEELECVEWFDLETTYQECKNRNEKFCVPMGSLELLREYLGSWIYKYNFFNKAGFS